MELCVYLELFLYVTKPCQRGHNVPADVGASRLSPVVLWMLLHLTGFYLVLCSDSREIYYEGFTVLLSY